MTMRLLVVASASLNFLFPLLLGAGADVMKGESADTTLRGDGGGDDARDGEGGVVMVMVAG